MSRVRAYLELFRLPNVFTAIADVMMGYLVTRADMTQGAELGLLVAASALLYTAGMVLNDVFDVEQDRRERPDRPIPSGQVPRSTALWLGVEMLVLGMACGWAVGAVGQAGARPGLTAVGLAGAVWLYDRVLKRTPLAPLAMGACRSLNVLLGMSTLPGPWEPLHYVIAAGIGLYIAGVTWFARTEAVASVRAHLAAAVVAMLAGLALLASYPHWQEHDAWIRPRLSPSSLKSWYLLWALLAASIAHRALKAVLDPAPAPVQRAVKHCIMSLIVIDAAVTFGARGMPAALLVLVLLMPMVVLGRWLYST